VDGSLPDEAAIIANKWLIKLVPDNIINFSFSFLLRKIGKKIFARGGRSPV
jgi:hypothetical protein